MVILSSNYFRRVKAVEESRTGSWSLQSSIVSGVVDRKDGNGKIDGFGKWSTNIYTLRFASNKKPNSFIWILASTVYPIWHASGHIIVKPDHVITWLRWYGFYNRHYSTWSLATRSNTLVHDCCGSHFTDDVIPWPACDSFSVNISEMWIISLLKHRTALHYLTLSTA